MISVPTVNTTITLYKLSNYEEHTDVELILTGMHEYL